MSFHLHYSDAVLIKKKFPYLLRTSPYNHRTFYYRRKTTRKVGTAELTVLLVMYRNFFWLLLYCTQRSM